MLDRIVPLHKNDMYAVRLLNRVSGPKVLAVADELLEWLEDGNWPVSGRVATALCPHVNELKDKLLVILRSYDGQWKYWCITLLIKHNNAVDHIDEELLAELRRIVAAPTESELREEVPEYAQEALDRWDHAGSPNEK